MQSVIQLAAAMNTIYLGLHEIRTPAVRHEEDALRELSLIWESISPRSLDIGARINDATGLLQDRVGRFRDKDETVAAACVVTVGLYVALLIVAAFFARFEIPNLLAFGICVSGFLPILAALVLNLALRADLRHGIRPKRAEIERLLAEMRTIRAVRRDHH
ncbi:hypothetical protein [Afifella marina]|uniref:Uncharacterized protein n=1 Tax=Afifella marina DSM 2698 TaxID=1120955 RepID=A0A1G5P9A7_AFIMA|nr:hypothetical protein [Afifella marina]MBK1624386.1 hypothetical protein [Afifella marina DSM 2698]MBK1628118.1 hypothetical protein [Afifella marina]MBK5916552.1 hypothetical protein [Afifella marina]RAI18921.1 hypothetical protein CH311_13695 [Afifella marina DSM 2698]SCZ46153.1 hypothetical protein SAMN03080610_03577 [Afifella marina DSM 2698]